MMTISHSGPGEDWLQVYLQESVRKNLCTKIRCTTCGAREFRRGLFVALAGATGRQRGMGFDLENAIAIARALARVHPITGEAWRFEEAVRLVLFDLWYMIGQVAAERELEPVLSGSWAGDVLARMKAHYKEREAAQRAFAESQEPVLVQQRREEKRRLRQEKHAERLALKKERDRAWREKETKADS